jgi:hypothetical protein
MRGKKRSADELPKELAKPPLRALHRAHVRTVSDAEPCGGGALAKLHGIGPRALRILNDALSARRSATSE